MAEETKNIEQELEDEVVMLLDEEGNEIPFHYITTLEHEGKEYVYLQQATDDEEEGGEIEIYELETVVEDGEEFDSLLPVEEETYELLYAKLIEAINAEAEGCSCGCGDDCDCGDDCTCGE